MTRRPALLDIVADEAARSVRRMSRGQLTALVIGGYAGGVIAAAGGLVLAGIRIGRKKAAS